MRPHGTWLLSLDDTAAIWVIFQGRKLTPILRTRVCFGLLASWKFGRVKVGQISDQPTRFRFLNEKGTVRSSGSDSALQ